jgi:DNA-binding response OmpR family regulator
LTFDDLTIDQTRQEATLAGQVIPLKEYDLLVFLPKHTRCSAIHP